jgi:hypothetical protein
MLTRPDTTLAKTYKLKSAFIKNSLFLTCGYIVIEDKNYPIEIFINSKDLTHSNEFTVLTRLISAIFRRNNDVSFIIDELNGIFDPNGGRHKDGKHFNSFYDEIAGVLKSFFKDIGYGEQGNNDNN